jgi:hypothetical protein
MPTPKASHSIVKILDKSGKIRTWGVVTASLSGRKATVDSVVHRKQ